MTDIYTRLSDSFDGVWYSYTYKVVGGPVIRCREWARDLEAGRRRLEARLKRMSGEYQGRLPPGRYAKNNTISMNDNRRRKGK